MAAVLLLLLLLFKEGLVRSNLLLHLGTRDTKLQNHNVRVA